MSIFIAYRYRLAIGISAIGQMISRSAFDRDTRLVDAFAAFPASHLCAIVEVRTAMIHIIGFALLCKNVFICQTLGIARFIFDARCSALIARRSFVTLFDRFPISRNTLIKHVVVAIPSVVGANRRRARFIASHGDEHRCNHRQPI